MMQSARRLATTHCGSSRPLMRRPALAQGGPSGCATGYRAGEWFSTIARCHGGVVRYIGGRS